INVKTAEGVYKDAILKAAGIVEDKPLNNLEKNCINKCGTGAKMRNGKKT
ncbi:15203_t:CDS:1, partial [Gigaspora margarita]